MSFHPIDGGAVVYDRNAKRLIALNAAAALIWIAVRDGSAPQAIRSKLAASFNLAEHEAERWIELTLASFEEIISNAGAEDEALPTTAFKLMTGTDYKILDKSLRISAPDTALQLIDSMIGHLRCPRSVARSDGADMSMSIEPVEQSFAVSSSGDPTATTKQAEELAAEVERRIVQDLVPRVPHFLAFHAALLDLRGRAVLFPAPSGSGKTTLSAALTRQGWYCLTDEMALLDRSLQWQGLPFLPCIKAENYPLISSFYPALGDVVEHERSGRRVKFLPLPIRTGRVEVSTVIFPEHAPDAEGSLNSLPSLDGLQRLLAQCVYVPPGFAAVDVPKLLKWHTKVEYFTLTFGSPAQAVAILCEAPRKNLGRQATPV
jgi:hypothetical protein